MKKRRLYQNVIDRGVYGTAEWAAKSPYDKVDGILVSDLKWDINDPLAYRNPYLPTSNTYLQKKNNTKTAVFIGVGIVLLFGFGYMLVIQASR